jgi:hypothetical protein
VESDWYKTSKAGTYLVVPAGTKLSALDLPDDIRGLLDMRMAFPFAESIDSYARALSMNRLGVDDCLKHSGYCLIRS